MRSGGIYKIYFLSSSSKVYIGSTINFQKRKNSHLHDLKNNKHPNQHLQRAFNFYGEENFIFEKIIDCKPENLLIEEEKYINIFDSFNNGYNLIEHPTRNNLGLVHTEDSKLKMSQSHKKRGRISGKFDAFTVQQIREKYYNGIKINNLAKEYNTHHITISRIVNLQTYLDVDLTIDEYIQFIEQKKEDYKNGIRLQSRGWKHNKKFIENFIKAVTKPNIGARKLSKQQILNIRQQKEDGLTCVELGEIYGVCQNTISRIVRKLIYKEI